MSGVKSGIVQGGALVTAMITVLCVNVWALQSMWKWFVVPIAPVKELSFLGAWGLMLFLILVSKNHLTFACLDFKGDRIAVFLVNLLITLTVWFAGWLVHLAG